MHISLELLSTEGDRLEGRLVTDDARADIPFSGTLDLLRAIEEAVAGTAIDLSAPAQEGSPC